MGAQPKRGRWIAVGLAVGLVMAWGGFTVAQAVIPAPGGVIKGCYKKSGNLRVVESSATCKAGKETAIQWNQTGPTGPAGPSSGLGDLFAAATFRYTHQGCSSTAYRIEMVRTWGQPLSLLSNSCQTPTDQGSGYFFMSSTAVLATATTTNDLVIAPQAQGPYQIGPSGMVDPQRTNNPIWSSGTASANCGASWVPAGTYQFAVGCALSATSTQLASIAQTPESAAIVLLRLPSN